MSPASAVASLLWIEGVDFDQTLYDTNQLSVVRGASLTLLAIGRRGEEILTEIGAKPTLVFSGASQALFSLPCDEKAAEGHLALLLSRLYLPNPNDAPFHHMQWVGGVALDDKTARAPRLAQARARLMQMNGTALRRTFAPQTQACAFNRHQPADTSHWFSVSQAEKYGVTGKPKDSGREVPLSSASKARYLYGRTQRQAFYRENHDGDGAFGKVLAGLGDHIFIENLQDMVDLGDTSIASTLQANLPVSLHNKVAIFYADGNGFGAIRDKMGGTADAIAEFSTALRSIMAQASAAALDVVAKGAKADAAAFDYAASVFIDREEKEASRQKQIRFETLLYGGDEVCFVAPSWLGLELAQAFFKAVQDAKVTDKGGKEHPLTFKAGLVFAPCKMSIAVSQNLVKALADDAKMDGNTLSIQVFESIDPPKDSIGGLRKRLLGFDNAEAMKSHAGGGLFVLDCNAVDTLMSDLDAITGDDGIPRSQLYRMLQQGVWMAPKDNNANKGFKPLANARKLNDELANSESAKVVATYVERSGYNLEGLWAERLKSKDTAALAAYAITQLWDYVAPVARAKPEGTENVA